MLTRRPVPRAADNGSAAEDEDHVGDRGPGERRGGSASSGSCVVTAVCLLLAGVGERSRSSAAAPTGTQHRASVPSPLGHAPQPAPPHPPPAGRVAAGRRRERRCEGLSARAYHSAHRVRTSTSRRGCPQRRVRRVTSASAPTSPPRSETCEVPGCFTLSAGSTTDCPGSAARVTASDTPALQVSDSTLARSARRAAMAAATWVLADRRAPPSRAPLA